MNVRRWIALTALALVGAAACDRAATAPELRAGNPPVVHATMARIPVATRPQLLVDARWLMANLHRRNVVVLYFGTQATYDAGHIPGARYIALSQIQAAQGAVRNVIFSPATLRAMLEAAGVSTRDRVIVTGDSPREAARGFVVLEYVGHQQVAMLDGGFAAWTLVGGPVSTAAAPAPKPGKLARPAQGDVIVSTDWMVAHLDDRRLTIIDALPPATYVAGHIPGAKNLPWNLLYQATGAPVLQDVATMRQLFADAGVTRQNQRMVAYCATGMTSSLVYFAARYLGFDVSLYDGSTDAWTAAGLPYEK